MDVQNKNGNSSGARLLSSNILAQVLSNTRQNKEKTTERMKKLTIAATKAEEANETKKEPEIMKEAIMGKGKAHRLNSSATKMGKNMKIDPLHWTSLAGLSEKLFGKFPRKNERLTK